MVSAHDPGNGPGASGPGIAGPSRIRPRQTAGTATDLHRSPPVTPDTPGKPGRSAYQGIQSDISARSRLLKRCTPRISRETVFCNARAIVRRIAREHRAGKREQTCHRAYRRWSADADSRPAARLEAVFHPRPAWPRLRGGPAGEYGAKFVHIGVPGRLRPVTAETAFFFARRFLAQPSAANQIRNLCILRTYRPFVLTTNRTQASRTMNAEPAQAVTERVN